MSETRHEAAIEAMAAEINPFLFAHEPHRRGAALRTARKAAAAYEAALGEDDDAVEEREKELDRAFRAGREFQAKHPGPALGGEGEPLRNEKIARALGLTEAIAGHFRARDGAGISDLANEIVTLLRAALAGQPEERDERQREKAGADYAAQHDALSALVGAMTNVELFKSIEVGPRLRGALDKARAALAGRPEVDPKALCTCGHTLNWHWDWGYLGGVATAEHCEHGDETTGKKCVCQRFALPDDTSAQEEGASELEQTKTVAHAWTETIRLRARTVGYAIGAHGSQARDLDLIAAPWTNEAGTVQELLDAVCVKDEDGCYELSFGPPNPKPHGRVGFQLHGIARLSYIDLSIMPCTPQDVLDSDGERDVWPGHSEHPLRFGDAVEGRDPERPQETT